MGIFLIVLEDEAPLVALVVIFIGINSDFIPEGSGTGVLSMVLPESLEEHFGDGIFNNIGLVDRVGSIVSSIVGSIVG